MNLYLFIITLLSTLLTHQVAYADVYQLQLKRTQTNTYLSREGYIITTRNCPAQPSQFKDVVLIYPRENYIKKHILIFTQENDTQICDIKSIQKGPTFPKIIEN